MADINVQLSDPAGQTALAFESGMRIATAQGVDTPVILHALAKGATNKGDKLLFKTLAVLTDYLTSWGAWVILLFGMFQLTQSVAAVVEKFISAFSKIGALFGAAGKFIDFVLQKLSGKDGEGELVVNATIALVTAAVPETGIALGIFGKVLGVGASKTDRVGGVVHDDSPNYGLVGVRPSNFRMVDEDEADSAIEDAVLDIGASLGQAAIRAGADPDVYMDEVERVLHDEVLADSTYAAMHDHLGEVIDDLADD
jgi:hypothetical protein